MGILKKEYKIGMAFVHKPWKKLSYSDIASSTKIKSKGYIYNAIKRMKDEKIIGTEKIGKSILYNLNSSSSLVQNYAGFLNEHTSWNQKHIPLHAIENIRSKIPTPFFILLLTGSYAKKTQTRKSDLDIVIICENEPDSKRIKAEISHECETSIPLIHPNIFTKEQFLEMLMDKEENYGKEAARHNFIFYGGPPYYSILNEAMRNGFRG